MYNEQERTEAMSDRTVNAQRFNDATRPAPVEYYDIGTMTIGQVLEVKTHTGSTYWITRVSGTYRTTTRVIGVSITSNSRGWGRTTSAPRDCAIDRYIYLGRRVRMSGTGVIDTSTVVTWREI